MKSFLQFFFENFKSINKTIDIFDDITDKKKGEQTFKYFNIDFDDGANAYGRVEGNIANIAGINAPTGLKYSDVKRGTKTYQRVLKILVKNGIYKIKIPLQSQDSKEAINKLIQRKILINPSGIMGPSIDQFPTIFDINEQQLMLEYRHNLADGTSTPSIQAHNGKNPNRIGPDKKKLHTVGPYKNINPKLNIAGSILTPQELTELGYEYEHGKIFDNVRNSGMGIEMTSIGGKPVGRVFKSQVK